MIDFEYDLREIVQMDGKGPVSLRAVGPDAEHGWPAGRFMARSGKDPVVLQC